MGVYIGHECSRCRRTSHAIVPPFQVIDPAEFTPGTWKWRGTELLCWGCLGLERNSPSEASPELGALRLKWRLVLAELKRARMAHVAAVLTDTEPERLEGSILQVRFPYQAMAEMFFKRAHEFSPALSAAIQRITGFSLEIRVVYP